MRFVTRFGIYRLEISRRELTPDLACVRSPTRPVTLSEHVTLTEG